MKHCVLVFALALSSTALAAEAVFGAFTVDETTGAIRGCAAGDGRSVATRFENVYHLMTKAGAATDVDARERGDRVFQRIDGDGFVAFRCVNPKLPDIEITKRYESANGGLRRTLAFHSDAGETRFMTPFTECHFDSGFQKGVWHLGAGYIGPYKPFPSEAKPRPVNEYKQSSKGLVFIHPDGAAGNFSHYRVKIDDQVVFPWWHSAIGRYRELHDRLWYLPDGYRMGLGTFGLYPGMTISITDQFNVFGGDMFTFFDGIFGKDPDIVREIASIPPGPDWCDDLLSVGGGEFDDYLRWMLEMTDEGALLPRHWGNFSWGEYKYDKGMRGVQGGRITGREMADFMESMRSRDPKRVHPSLYQIVIATSWFTDVFRDHPKWFRVHDREGRPDSLFPGVSDNWQTMFCYPECRQWLVDMLLDFAKALGNDDIYVDESQMTNTIDWDRMRVTLDSDTVKFWKLFRERLHERGMLFFANGSGNVYADLNYMESPVELAPSLWRDWAGVGWGIGLFNRLRPAMRMSLLNWRPGLDYSNRILALGWIPHSNFTNTLRLPVIRTVYASGYLLPVNVKYTPDWKTDAKTEIESHSVRKVDCGDVLLSFISRRKGVGDLPVTVDLGTLGFAADERINVWKLHVDEERTGNDVKRILPERTLKANWRERGVLDGARITDPELVMSGPATGMFKDVIRDLAENRMEQYLFTASPASIFAENDLPQGRFHTRFRHASVDGRKVKAERSVDILLADRGRDFEDVTVDSKPAAVRRIRLSGGLVGTLVRLGPGEWTLGWRETPRRTGEERTELPVAGGEMVSGVTPPQRYIEPAVFDVKDVNEKHGDVTVLRSGVFRTQCETIVKLQENLSVTCSSADPKSLHLVAGPSRREFMPGWLETAAGFELSGARQLKLRFSHNFDDSSLGIGRNRFKVSENMTRATAYFCGVTVDYSVGGKYAKRVTMSAGYHHPDCELNGARWGKYGRADEKLDFGPWIEEPSPKVFSLDLLRHAPKDWDGRCWLSIGTCHLPAGHHIALDILSFNDASAKDFVVPLAGRGARAIPPPLRSKPLKAPPKSLDGIDAAEWKGWTKATPFMGLGSGRPRAQTAVYLAHDRERVYFGIEADEPERPFIFDGEAWASDNVQILIRRPDGKVYQVIADPRGRYAHMLDRVRDKSGKDGIAVCGEVENGRCWRLFIAIPVASLGIDARKAPVSLKATITRERKNYQERSAWSPIEAAYFELDNYGTMVFDFD